MMLQAYGWLTSTSTILEIGIWYSNTSSIASFEIFRVEHPTKSDRIPTLLINLWIILVTSAVSKSALARFRLVLQRSCRCVVDRTSSYQSSMPCRTLASKYLSASS